MWEGEKIMSNSEFVVMMWLFPFFFFFRGQGRTFENVREDFFMNFKTFIANTALSCSATFSRTFSGIPPQQELQAR